MQRMKLDLYLILHKKNQFEKIKDLNMRPETTKLLEEHIEKKLLILILVMIALRVYDTKSISNKIKS